MRGLEVAWERWALWTNLYALAAGGDFITTYLALTLPGVVEANPRIEPFIGTPLHLVLLLAEIALASLLFLAYALAYRKGCRAAGCCAAFLIVWRFLPVLNNVCVIAGLGAPLVALQQYFGKLVGGA